MGHIISVTLGTIRHQSRPAVVLVLANMLVFLICAPAHGESVACGACHPAQHTQFTASIHAEVITCRNCHGGQREYDVSNVDALRIDPSAPSRTPAQPSRSFDHGSSFRGKPTRRGVLHLCGDCHADVARMNPYGLRTDELAAYRTSGHGKHLAETGDDTVAVCIDCHGIHDILPRDNPNSRTYFANIPGTCATCHADPKRMSAHGLPTDIVDQYRGSIHGHLVLEQGDSGAPNCATCHGSHGAAPPGFAEVGHVCGKCHQQVEQYFLESVHGRLPRRVSCVACHGGTGDPRNHHITKATPAADKLVEIYRRVAGAVDTSDAKVRGAFTQAVDNLDTALRPASVCPRCHVVDRPRPGHRVFFKQSDQIANQRAMEMTKALRDAQYEYARAAARIDRLSRGVLLVRDEALRVEDAKTALMAVATLTHTIDIPQIQAGSEKTLKICREINESLDGKVEGLEERERSPTLVWVFAGVFCVLMYRKYRLLKHAYVVPADAPVPAKPEGEPPRRRAMLDMVLSLLGLVTIGGLVWPAVAYILPVRKRGSSVSRVTAGKDAEWAPWEGRKVSVGGKPVAVFRTADGYRAYSAICTHLGCIIHWEKTKREFACPCHGAIFDQDGKVVSGPAPKPLPRYDARVVQGDVIVSEMSS